MKDKIPLAPLQRMAWFNLIVFAIAVALYLIAVPFFVWRLHMTLAGAALPSLGVFGVCGLWGLGNYFLYDRKRRAKLKLDERESLINQRAATIGVVLFWEVFVFLCIGVWAYFSYVRHQATVPVGFLPFLVMFGFVVFMVTQSIAILVQYRRSTGDDTL
ncbi:MAG: hypothetical protein ACLQM6_01155 [Acidobacteriaceae bacterium]